MVSGPWSCLPSDCRLGLPGTTIDAERGPLLQRMRTMRTRGHGELRFLQFAAMPVNHGSHRVALNRASNSGSFFT